jgi:steroid delta-isomerase-like uncharacterized protein
MKNKDIRDIATAYMQIWSSGKDSLLDTLAHKDLEVYYTHFEKTYNGISDYKVVLKMTYEFFPDLSIELLKVIPNEQDNIVTVSWEYKGTHKNGNLFGVEAADKAVSVKGITLLEIENGLVKKECGIVDNLSLIMQLGVLN